MREGYKPSNADVKTAAELVARDGDVDLQEHFLKGLTPGQAACRSENDQPAPLSRRHRQQRHRVWRRSAGTGKTYLAMARAVAYSSTRR
jgi:hypothetical protein